MSEENGTTDAVVAEPTAAQPTSYIGEDGTLNDGWKDKYLTDDIKNERIFERTNTLQGVFKSLANAERMVGADKIVKPNDKYGDEDWDNFYKAAGWTGEAMPMAPPDGIPDGVWSEDRANAFSEVFNELRLTPKQQAGIVEAYNKDLLQQITDMSNNSEMSAAELKANLLSEWGNAYTQKEHLANFTVEKGTGGDVEFKERILQKFGNDPDFIKYSANLGSNFSESGAIPTVTTAPTPDDLQTQINKIMNSEAFMKPMHPEHKTTMKNLARLHQEKAQVRQPA